MTKTFLAALATTCLIGRPLAAQQTPAQQPAQQEEPQEPMTFFVTSTVPGHGNLGGLEGADQICQELAEAAEAGDRTWRAYLSTQEADGQPAVNARDRIGTGPWHNFSGDLIAANVEDLHGDVERDRNNIHKATAIDENGNVVNGRGDEPNQHDILTGSDFSWPGLARGRGPHLPELDQRLSRRTRLGRPSRSGRRWQHLVELGACYPGRLPRRGPAIDRWRGPLLLLCGELRFSPFGWNDDAAAGLGCCAALARPDHCGAGAGAKPAVVALDATAPDVTSRLASWCRAGQTVALSARRGPDDVDQRPDRGQRAIAGIREDEAGPPHDDRARVRTDAGWWLDHRHAGDARCVSPIRPGASMRCSTTSCSWRQGAASDMRARGRARLRGWRQSSRRAAGRTAGALAKLRREDAQQETLAESRARAKRFGKMARGILCNASAGKWRW